MKDLDPRGLPWPDVDALGRGNSGIDYIHRFESSAPGPHVMITALVHGNEVSGAIGLDWLLRQGPNPARGTLSLGFMNVAAYKAIDFERPYDNRFVDEDFNRLWTAETLDGPRSSVELTRGRVAGLMLLVLSLSVFNLVGLALLGVGLLVTLPLSYVVLARAFREAVLLVPGGLESAEGLGAAAQ